MAIERRLDDAALDTAAASMNDAHFREAGGHGCVDIVGDDRGNVARCERVQIDLALDRKVDR
ncbi:MAG TPA: hypothetical protein VKE96_17550 [Vicinamibacterales bacterium]|nr:hypothetical protein [Vicinamibacterales bacterium]